LKNGHLPYHYGRIIFSNIYVIVAAFQLFSYRYRLYVFYDVHPYGIAANISYLSSEKRFPSTICCCSGILSAFAGPVQQQYRFAGLHYIAVFGKCLRVGYEYLQVITDSLGRIFRFNAEGLFSGFVFQEDVLYKKGSQTKNMGIKSM